MMDVLNLPLFYAQDLVKYSQFRTFGGTDRCTLGHGRRKCSDQAEASIIIMIHACD